LSFLESIYTSGKKVSSADKYNLIYTAFMGQESEDCAKKNGWYAKIEDSFFTAASLNSDKTYLQLSTAGRPFADGDAVWRRASEVKLQVTKLKGWFVNWFKEQFPNHTLINLPSGVTNKEVLNMFRCYLFRKEKEAKKNLVNLSNAGEQEDQPGEMEEEEQEDDVSDDYQPNGNLI